MVTTIPMSSRLAAEAVGTFVLVLGGVGSAILAGEAIGPSGVALAFGLTILTMAFALGPISGGHFNPAVTVGLAAARRFEWSSVMPYVAAQISGGVLGGLIIWAIGSGNADFDRKTSFAGASNGWGDVIGGYSLLAVLITEIVFTALFVFIILGVTSGRTPDGFAPIAIGLGLTLIHLVTIPIDNTSVNPARSIAAALLGGGDSIEQLWAFIVAPLIGGIVGGIGYVAITGGSRSGIDIEGNKNR
ncbi:MAG: aquaporin Z [Aeromicrobium sp.]